MCRHNSLDSALVRYIWLQQNRCTCYLHDTSHQQWLHICTQRHANIVRVDDSWRQARTQDFAKEGATCSRRGPQVTQGPPWRLGAQETRGPRMTTRVHWVIRGPSGNQGYMNETLIYIFLPSKRFIHCLEKILKIRYIIKAPGSIPGASRPSVCRPHLRPPWQERGWAPAQP